MKKFTLICFVCTCLFSTQILATTYCNPQQILTLKSLEGDAVDDKETLLYNLVNDYRAENGLAAIPLSTSLSLVANRHVRDAYENTGYLNYGWSNCPFDSKDRTTFTCMWNAPQRLGTSYLGTGYENIYATTDGSEVIPSEALNVWKQNKVDNKTLLNGYYSNAMGIGIYQGYAALWFGHEVDNESTTLTFDQEGRILELYSAYFNRAADKEGFTHWKKSFSNITGDNPEKEDEALQTITSDMATSAEYLAFYPPTQPSINYIEAIYTNLLQRSPDAEGLTFWSQILDKGKMSKGQAILHMIAGSKANCTVQGLADSALIANRTKFSKYILNLREFSDSQEIAKAWEEISCDPLSVIKAIESIHPEQPNDNTEAISNLKWTNTNISVCWENLTPANEYYRNLVIQSVEETWVKHSKIKFTGWQECTNRPADIRIVFKDEQPHTKMLGKKLKNVPEGMLLNHVLNKWSFDCKKQKEFCLKATAVHEFGHALGFIHSQDRNDAPAWCKKDNPDISGLYVGPWDIDSVMNYCNSDFNNSGQLSEIDIFAIQKIYGFPEVIDSLTCSL